MGKHDGKVAVVTGAASVTSSRMLPRTNHVVQTRTPVLLAAAVMWLIPRNPFHRPFCDVSGAATVRVSVAGRSGTLPNSRQIGIRLTRAS